MKKTHAVLSKKQCFILFNLIAFAVLTTSGRLTSSRQSLIGYLLAILVVNGIAAISATNYPQWK